MQSILYDSALAETGGTAEPRCTPELTTTQLVQLRSLTECKVMLTVSLGLWDWSVLTDAKTKITFILMLVLFAIMEITVNKVKNDIVDQFIFSIQ